MYVCDVGALVFFFFREYSFRSVVFDDVLPCVETWLKNYGLYLSASKAHGGRDYDSLIIV